MSSNTTNISERKETPKAATLRLSCRLAGSASLQAHVAKSLGQLGSARDPGPTLRYELMPD